MCTCDEALTLISARLDGPLSAGEEAQLEAHLAACPACRDLLADLEDLHGAMPALWAEPPAGLTEQVMDRIRTESAPIPLQTPRRQWKRWLAMAAVFAVIILGAGGVRWIGLGHLGANSSSGGAAPAAADAAAPAGGGLNAIAQADMDGGISLETAADCPAETAAGNGAVSMPVPYSASEETVSGGSRIADGGAAPEFSASEAEPPAAMPAAPSGTAEALDLIYRQLGGPVRFTAGALSGQKGTGLLLRRAEGAPEDTPAYAALLCAGGDGAMFHCHIWDESQTAWADSYYIWTVAWDADGAAELQREQAEGCPLCVLPASPE